MPQNTHRRRDGPLKLMAVAERLNLSLLELCTAAGCARSTMHGIGQYNLWPTRMVVKKQGLIDLLAKRGATPEELATMFEKDQEAADAIAQSSKRTKSATNVKDYIAATNATAQEEEIMFLGKRTLTLQTRKHFALFNNPFDGDVTCEDEMFVSGEIRFIREACWQTAIAGSFVAIVGESGAGKTTILGDLKDRIVSSNQAVIMIEPSVLGMEDRDTTGKTIKSGDILRAGINTLDNRATVMSTIEARTRQFLKLLQESVTAGNNHMLVIEEAHSLPISTLKHLKRLHEKSRIGRRAALGILLIAQPELRDKLSPTRHDVREVYQRCEILELQPLDADLPDYLAHRAKQAGKKLEELITDDGIAEIRNRLTVQRRVSGGNSTRSISLVYPLAVNNLFVAALNTAADLGAPVIDKDIVRKAS